MTFLHQTTQRACLVALLLTCACGSDDKDTPSGNGGTTGTAGTASGGSNSGKAGNATTTGGKSGSAGSTGSAGKSSGTGGSATGNGDYLPPAPLVCRDTDVTSMPDGGKNAFDGDYGFSSTWRSPPDGWVTINIGEGPSKLLFVWHTDSTPDYTITPDINFGAPTAYRIETSPTGADGSWTKAVEVTGEPDNTSYRSRGHSIDFEGMAFVRWTLTKLVSGQGNPNAQISEVEIHDISKGADDSWAVVGLGQARSTYHGHVGMFPELVHKAHPDYYPALIDLAEAGGEAKKLVTAIDKLLELNPDFHFWILAYGMGDAENNRSPAETDFKKSMQSVIDKVKAAGKVPLIPRIEKVTHSNHTTVADFNTVIDELVMENDLPPAPDLYALLTEKPELLCTTGCEGGHEGLDLTPAGADAVNALWAETIDPLYAP